MRAFVHTEILDHSISAKKILDSADPSNSIDLIYSITASTCNIGGGTLDGVAIGSSTAATTIRASNYISLYSGGQNFVQLTTTGVDIYRSGFPAVPVISLNGTGVADSYFNVNKCIFGSTGFPASPSCDYYFNGIMLCASTIYATYLQVQYAGTWYDVSEIAYRNSLIPLTAGWWDSFVALTKSELDQLANINLKTISAANWTYLSGLDQGVSTSSSPSFVSLLVTGALAVGGSITTTGKATIGSVGGISVQASGDINTSADVNATGDVNCDDLQASSSVYGPTVYADVLNLNSNKIIENVHEYIRNDANDPLYSPGTIWGSGSAWKSVCRQINPYYALDGLSGVNSTDMRSFEFWGTLVKTAGSGAIYTEKWIRLDLMAGVNGTVLADGGDEDIAIDLYAIEKYSTTVTKWKFQWRFTRSITLTQEWAIRDDGSYAVLTLSPYGSFHSTTLPTGGGRIWIAACCDASTTQPYLTFACNNSGASRMFVHGKFHVMET